MESTFTNFLNLLSSPLCIPLLVLPSLTKKYVSISTLIIVHKNFHWWTDHSRVGTMYEAVMGEPRAQDIWHGQDILECFFNGYSYLGCQLL